MMVCLMDGQMAYGLLRDDVFGLMRLLMTESCFIWLDQGGAPTEYCFPLRIVLFFPFLHPPTSFDVMSQEALNQITANHLYFLPMGNTNPFVHIVSPELFDYSSFISTYMFAIAYYFFYFIPDFRETFVSNSFLLTTFFIYSLSVIYYYNDYFT